MTLATVRQPRPTLAASAGAPERIRNRWVDIVFSPDPGLNWLRGALQSVLTIAVAVAAEWTFVHLTGAPSSKETVVPSRRPPPPIWERL